MCLRFPLNRDCNRDKGKENGTYYIVYWGYIGVI